MPSRSPGTGAPSGAVSLGGRACAVRSASGKNRPAASLASDTPSVYSSSASPTPTGNMLAWHRPWARSSNPSGGAGYGSMNAADPPRSSSGAGCPQQISSAHDPLAGSVSSARSTVAGKFTSSAVTNRSGSSDWAISACSRTAMAARLGSA
jgi:hypothetical protein